MWVVVPPAHGICKLPSAPWSGAPSKYHLEQTLAVASASPTQLNAQDRHQHPCPSSNTCCILKFCATPEGRRPHTLSAISPGARCAASCCAGGARARRNACCVRPLLVIRRLTGAAARHKAASVAWRRQLGVPHSIALFAVQQRRLFWLQRRWRRGPGEVYGRPLVEGASFVGCGWRRRNGACGGRGWRLRRGLWVGVAGKCAGRQLAW